ncbi:MAG: hypothetical protein DWQ04_04390 [Chloroflexi bacterium]|nr:MAG: hypothetical protein DWQ04_04390 [Chloroflexota bacterium]
MENSTEKSIQLFKFIQTLDDFQLIADSPAGYDHMGAIICDAGLQAGIKYETVVWPRVKHVLETFPEAKTTSAFQRVLMIVGATNLLTWRLDRKINTIVDLTQLFVSEGLETAVSLQTWLQESKNIERLKKIKGIGPKTADYFKILVGLPTSAIDIHLRRFIEQAGVVVTRYEAAQDVIRETAVLLKTDERTLDYSIWKYMAG